MHVIRFLYTKPLVKLLKFDFDHERKKIPPVTNPNVLEKRQFYQGNFFKTKLSTF